MECTTQRITSGNIDERFERFSASLNGTTEYALDLETVKERAGAINFYNLVYGKLQVGRYILHDEKDFAIKVKVLDGEFAFVELYSLIHGEVKEWRYTEALSTEYPFLIR